MSGERSQESQHPDGPEGSVFRISRQRLSELYLNVIGDNSTAPPFNTETDQEEHTGGLLGPALENQSSLIASFINIGNDSGDVRLTRFRICSIIKI